MMYNWNKVYTSSRDVKISVDNDDGDDLGGFYLPSRNVDVHECTCNRRCRGQNRWNPP